MALLPLEQRAFDVLIFMLTAGLVLAGLDALGEFFRSNWKLFLIVWVTTPLFAFWLRVHFELPPEKVRQYRRLLIGIAIGVGVMLFLNSNLEREYICKEVLTGCRWVTIIGGDGDYQEAVIDGSEQSALQSFLQFVWFLLLLIVPIATVNISSKALEKSIEHRARE